MKYFVNHNKISGLILALLFFASAFSFSFASFAVLFAQSEPATPTLQRIVFNESYSYLYLNSPAAFDVCDEGILLSDFDGSIAVYNISTLEKTHSFSAPTVAASATFWDGWAIYLVDGNIIFESNSQKKQISGEYIDISLDRENGFLFALGAQELVWFDVASFLEGAGSELLEDELSIGRAALDSQLLGGVSAFCAYDGVVYFAAKNSANKNFDDVICFDSEAGIFYKGYERTRRIVDITCLSGEVFLLYSDEIVSFGVFDGQLSRKNAISVDATTIVAFDGMIYMLTTQNAMMAADSALTGYEAVFFSESKYSGFFSSPACVYTRRGNLFVADTFNDRLFVAGTTEQKTIAGFERISSVVSDNMGNTFVAHSINKITKLDSKYQPVETFAVPRAIKKLVIDIDNNVFVVTGAEFYVLNSAGLSELEGFRGVLDACVVMGSKALIVYDGNAISSVASPLGKNAVSVELLAKSGIKSLAADLASNVFFFDESGDLFRFDNESSILQQIDFDDSLGDLTFASSMFLSNVQNKYASYGDLLFSDPMRHCIYRLSSEAVGAVVVSDNHVSPDITQKTAIASHKAMVFCLKETAELYAKPIEVGSGQVLTKGTRVFYFDEYNSFEEFAFIVYEDTLSKQLACGYVFRNLISFASYGFSSPPLTEASVYFDNTPIYKLPSVHSVILRYYAKNTTLSLEDFAAPAPSGEGYSTGVYIDGFGRTWYRLALEDGGSGFIQADYLSINKYVPVVRPKANATIKASGEVNFATIYYFDESDMSYKPIEGELPLSVGTRVEIITTPLNPRNEYTEIRFYREGLGTLTCYVLTEHIEYDTINSVQIAAVIALTLIAFSATFLTVFLIRNKRKAKIRQ